MDRNGDPRFSNGLHLANLAVSSNLLWDSWNAISKLEQRINQLFQSYGDNPVIFEESVCQSYNIIAFVTSPFTTGRLQEERDLVPSSKIPDFQFLCSESNPTFCINKAAISLFNSLLDDLSRLKEMVVTSAKSKDSVPYIITGHCLGGSIACLFMLWLLNTLDATKLPLCITFGSPLLGDSDFQQAVSQYSTWNSCFLHVVHKDDCSPRLFLHHPTTNRSQYKPFGTFLLCSESGGACFGAPESVRELLTLKIAVENTESQSFNYENVIGCLEQKLIQNDCSRWNGQEADSFKAGVTTQVIVVGLEPVQLNEGSDALIEDIVKHEQGVIRRQREAFDPAKELDQMKMYLACLEWYMRVCKANGQGLGYYDSFKIVRERRDNGVDKYRTILSDYWKRVVKEAQKKPQIPGVPLRNRWLFGGTTYRRIVEPLDIAEYYKRGRKEYLSRGRSKHYNLLEQWLKDYQDKTPKARAGSSNSKLKNVMEDSCFWAHVEEAIRSCRVLVRGGSSNSSERAKLIEFKEYVMRLIKEYKVLPDIFLEKSSYMHWWREYEKILGDSPDDESQLVAFMRNELYKKYAEGSLNMSEEGHSQVNPPDSANEGLRSTEGPEVSP